MTTACHHHSLSWVNRGEVIVGKRTRYRPRSNVKILNDTEFRNKKDRVALFVESEIGRVAAVAVAGVEDGDGALGGIEMDPVAGVFVNFPRLLLKGYSEFGVAVAGLKKEADDIRRTK